MGIEAAIAIQVGSGIVSGIAAAKASKATQKQLKAQAELVRKEAKRDAGRLRIRHKQAVARKKLQFFKQGVGIAGSPANIIAGDINAQDEEARAIIARGDAQSQLLIAQGQNARNEGRAALLSNIVSGISSGIQTGVLANTLQMESLDVIGTAPAPSARVTLTTPPPSIVLQGNSTPKGFATNFNKAITGPRGGV